MSEWQGFLGALLWIIFRFGLPIFFTVLMVWIFKRLDAHWQIEAVERRASMGSSYAAPVIRCWQINDCPEPICSGCVAFQQQETPCWQHFRADDGTLKEECLGCRVFSQAPVPVIGD